ncbi:uncharacterized protein LOC113205164 isoform X2 [Frankliniella occidentalis]|uniref:Uncharacterized protein LOC113205164 isoform X2 n=1 Tax=Frankliniella occidentalis TaxID=133901 RepID=A0A9C6TVV2_FRAOC|nr:uncharacterized protein LOC113205164 isoform X2 [Frankliniella occidentalis]
MLTQRCPTARYGREGIMQQLLETAKLTRGKSQPCSVCTRQAPAALVSVMAFRWSIILVALIARQADVLGKSFNSFAGPWIGYVDRFYLCEEPNHPLPWRWHLRGTHFNPQKPTELQLLTGNMTFEKEPLDDSTWIKVLMAVWTNNQWKENSFIFHFKDKGCTAIKENMAGFYEIFFKKTETQGACIIKPKIEVADEVDSTC